MMPVFRIKEAAGLLRVSDDTLRRWVDGGRVETTTDASGRLAGDGAALARLAGDGAALARLACELAGAAAEREQEACKQQGRADPPGL